MARLNLGCADVTPHGWVNADCDRRWERAVYADPLGRLPWPDDYFEGAVSNHVLQMVSWVDLVPWLAEVRRVLAGGAVLRLLVPNLNNAVQAWRDDRVEWFPITDEIAPTIDDKLCIYITQASATKSVFTYGHLRLLCERAGFSYTIDARYGESRLGEPWLTELDSREHESLIVEARK